MSRGRAAPKFERVRSPRAYIFSTESAIATV
jgi:hypothetical protein